MAILAIGSTLFALSAIKAIASYAAGLGVPFFDWTFYAGAVNRWLAGEQIYPGGRISTLGSAAASKGSRAATGR